MTRTGPWRASSAVAVRRQPRLTGGHSLPHGDYRALIHQTGGPERPVTIEYVRYTPQGPTPNIWRPGPDNAAIVPVPGAEAAPTLEEGKALARAILAGLASGKLQGEERPFPPPPKAELVTWIDHPTKMLRVAVMRWPNGFEVRAIGYVPNGYALPAASPHLSREADFEWGQLDVSERLLADTEEEAMEAARAELERLAAEDLPVQDRPNGHES